MRVAVVCLSVAAVGGLGAVSMVNTSAGEPPRKAKTLRYVLRFPAPLFVDHAPAGFSAGDNVVVSGSIYDRRGRRRLGRHQAFCVHTVVGKALQCTTTTVVSGRGQLVSEGSFKPGGVGTVALVGGTGDFEGARGIRRFTTRPRTRDLIEGDLTFRYVR